MGKNKDQEIRRWYGALFQVHYSIVIIRLTAAIPNIDVVASFSIIGFVDDSICLTGGGEMRQ